MQDFEKLGAFYLGRPFDLKTKKPKEGLLLRFKRFANPRRLRGHDRQREDGIASGCCFNKHKKFRVQPSGCCLARRAS